jgi:hypothetical protein
MTLLDFGQPLGGISQFAYVVEDLDRAMAEYTDRLGVGPWFVRGPFQPPAGRHRGEPATFTVTLGRAFAGHAMIELIVQHDDGESVFHEGGGPRRYGFHHWGVLTQAFDADVDRYRALGYEEAFSDRLPSGARVVYMDATRDLPGMIELVEHTAEQERVYTEIYQASVGWDGTDPVRVARG